MKTLILAKESWQQLSTYSSIQDIKQDILQRSKHDLNARSIYWKTLLLFEDVDHSLWLRRLGDSRSAYVSLRGHFLRAFSHPDEVDGGDDPLSEDSPWKTFRADEDLRAEILQDVQRCMPDNTYFRQDRIQSSMVDILFIYCKLNPDVSYRQGMHEVLAPFLWVVECDAISDTTDKDTDFMICQLCDTRFVEHDTFTLFNVVMQNAKTFYEQRAHARGNDISSKPRSGKLENPILTIVARIFDDYLPRLDPELADHLAKIEIVSQVFLIRWIRLLFGREFALGDVLDIWDVIFCDDAGLRLVEIICLVMLLRIRWSLVDADHNEALTILLRYPRLDGTTAKGLALDALELQKDFTPLHARELVKRYSGKELPALPHLPDPDEFAIMDETEGKMPAVTPVSPRKLESIFQDAAKNVFDRSEKWGINKAVRDAVDEVRKGVKEIQTIQTPQSGRRHGRLMSRSSGGSQRMSELEHKLTTLQSRNDQLARMLKDTTDQLWQFQKTLSDEKGVEAEVVKDLSITIAKVGFVQVYLDDPTIPLPVDDSAAQNDQPVIDPINSAPEASSDTMDPSTTEPKGVEEIPPGPTPATPVPSSKPATTLAAPLPEVEKRPTPTLDAEKSRPTLAQSSFSWMLGQDERHGSSPLSATGSAGGANMSASPYSARPRSRGFLFGDDSHDDEIGSAVDVEEPVGGTPTRRRVKEKRVIGRRGGAQVGGHDGNAQGQREDGFDLNDLRRG